MENECLAHCKNLNVALSYDGVASLDLRASICKDEAMASKAAPDTSSEDDKLTCDGCKVSSASWFCPANRRVICSGCEKLLEPGVSRFLISAPQSNESQDWSEKHAAEGVAVTGDELFRLSDDDIGAPINPISSPACDPCALKIPKGEDAQDASLCVPGDDLLDIDWLVFGETFSGSGLTHDGHSASKPPKDSTTTASHSSDSSHSYCRADGAQSYTSYFKEEGDLSPVSVLFRHKRLKSSHEGDTHQDDFTFAQEQIYLTSSQPQLYMFDDSEMCGEIPGVVDEEEVEVPGRARSKRTRGIRRAWSVNMLSELVERGGSSKRRRRPKVKKQEAPVSGDLPSVLIEGLPSVGDSGPLLLGSVVDPSSTVLEGTALGDCSGSKRNAQSVDSNMLRYCFHCLTTKTPQWRAGPSGPKTLCNACGVRFKSGRLVPEYRPAGSPAFNGVQHSNSHRKILEMRRLKQMGCSEPQEGFYALEKQRGPGGAKRQQQRKKMAQASALATDAAPVLLLQSVSLQQEGQQLLQPHEPSALPICIAAAAAVVVPQQLKQHTQTACTTPLVAPNLVASTSAQATRISFTESQESTALALPSSSIALITGAAA